MVSLRRLVAISALLVPVLAQFCGTDTTGCVMCQGGYLLNCLETAQNATQAACSGLSTLLDQTTCFCQYYTTQSNCWATGRYCAEWISMQIEADKACGYAAKLKAGTPADNADPAATRTVSSLVSDQLRVSSSIWHNDAGTDIPTATDDINATPRTETWTSVATPTITTSFPLAASPVPIGNFAPPLTFAGATTSAASSSASTSGSVSSMRSSSTSVPTLAPSSAQNGGILGVLGASATPRTGSAASLLAARLVLLAPLLVLTL